MEDYPHLLFRKHWEVTAEAQYALGECDATIRSISNTPILPEFYQKLLRVSLNKGAQATTAIEGNTLTDEEVVAVAAGQPLAPSKEYQEIEVRNILDAFNTLLQSVAVEGKAEALSPELIMRFHHLIGKDLGAHFDAIPGKFRSDTRVVGSYIPPAHDVVPELVERLCTWLGDEFRFRSGQTFIDAVIEAIVAHVYLEWIHPFGDGNGRTGRLLEFYILLRAGNPDIASHILSNFYNETRIEYYRQLDSARRARDLTMFINYAVRGFRDGLRQTLNTIQQSGYAVTWREFIYATFADKKYRKKTVHKRQRDLILAMPTDSRLSPEQILQCKPEIAKSYANLSMRTLLRDLALLTKYGLPKHVDGNYEANLDVLHRQVPQRREH